MSNNDNQKITGYNNSKGLEYIKLHKKKYNLLRNDFISPNLNIFQRFKIAVDFTWCIFKYGSGINDYFQYNFYKMNSQKRSDFIVARKWKQIIIACNGALKNEIFDNKIKFNKQFNKYLNRDWIDSEACSYDEFCEFVNKHPVSIYKIKEGSGGNGIGLYKFDQSKDSNQQFEYIKSQHYMLEELIVQNEEMSEFNPSSVNTLRVVTVVKNGKVHVMDGVFRTGNGSGTTDNFHHYGLAALIDVNTGRVYTKAIDKKNQKYEKHPISGKLILGFMVPYWNEILETVKAAALEVPSVGYVGWDIAIGKDGNIYIIEGNCASDPDVVQMPDLIGKWPKYKAIIEGDN